MPGSRPFRLDATDLGKLGNSAMLAVAGIAVGLLTLVQVRAANAPPDSLLAVLITAVAPVLINFVRKWASDNRQPTLPTVNLTDPVDEPPPVDLTALAEAVLTSIARRTAEATPKPAAPAGPPQPSVKAGT